MSTARVAVPSRGRLRDVVLALLDSAGYPVAGFRGAGSRSAAGDLELIEMRPRDAAAWLAAGRIDAAFISTDLLLEEALDGLAIVPLGVARSDLVVASRDDDGRSSMADLAGAVVATHLPNATRRWFEREGVAVTIVAMGGALEGVCAAGLADAIVDLRETGTSLAQNRLRVLGELGPCEAVFAHQPGAAVDGLALRIGAVLEARRHRYVMLHLPPDRVHDLATVFSGLAAPTVLPLAERDDLLAVHLVVPSQQFWDALADLRALGATGIVALPPDGLLR